MYDIVGQYNTATVYAACVDSESHAQVLRMCNVEELKDCRIRMMPDMHASEGCTVGTSMTVGEKINPSYVGGDIGAVCRCTCWVTSIWILPSWTKPSVG